MDLCVCISTCVFLCIYRCVYVCVEGGLWAWRTWPSNAGLSQSVYFHYSWMSGRGKFGPKLSFLHPKNLLFHTCESWGCFHFMTLMRMATIMQTMIYYVRASSCVRILGGDGRWWCLWCWWRWGRWRRRYLTWGPLRAHTKFVAQHCAFNFLLPDPDDGDV